MRPIVLAIVALVASPAFAQAPIDWTKPVTGVDAPAAPARAIVETVVIVSHAQQAPAEPTVGEQTATAEETPLPPPCEPPTPRTPPQPGPPSPCPTPR